jgi:hypothetical protein
MIYLHAYAIAAERNDAWPMDDDIQTPPAEIYTLRGYSVVHGRVIYARATHDSEGLELTPESASPAFWAAVLDGGNERNAAIWADPACLIEIGVVNRVGGITASKAELTPEQAGAVFEPMLAGLL